MSMTDPISDLLTRIRNAQSAKKLSVSMPASRLKAAVARVLEQEGYVTSVETGDAEGKEVLTVNLKYHEGQGVIEKLQRVSRPGLRIYRGANELPQVEGGLGVAIISTSKGVMSDRAARSQGHGGEVLCIVS